jgi:hypothetical protein
MRPAVHSLLFLATLGCTGTFKDTTDTASAADDPGAGGEPAEEIEDVAEELEADPDCDTVAGSEVAGATSYFIGNFDITGEEVAGAEQWVLRANSAWAAEGGADCAPTETCGSCDYSLDIDASLDASRTDCEDDLWTGDEQFSNTYNVKLTESGDATFYFAGSGDVLAAGTGSSSGARYVTESTCVYF